MNNVQALVDDLKGKEGSFKKSLECKEAAKAYQIEYRQRFNDITDNTKDRHGQDGHPEAATPYPPL